MAILVLKIFVDVCWYLGVLGPLLPVFPLPVRIVAYAIPLMYAASLFARQKNFGVQMSNQDIFLWQCKILLVSTALELGFAGIGPWERSSAVYIFLFLAFGVLFLRITRLGGQYQKDKRFWLLNGVYVAAVLLLAFTGTSHVVLQSVAWVVKGLYLHVIVPVLLVFLYLLAIVLSLFVGLFPSGKTTSFDIDSLVATDQLQKQLEDTEIKGIPPMVQYVAIAVLVLVIIIALRAVYKKLLDASGTTGSKQVSSVTKSRIDKNDGGFGKEKVHNKEERSVRTYYLKFLRLCMKNGIAILPVENSAEVQNKASSLWNVQELMPLRKVYVKARYSGKDVSEADVEVAKEEYRKLKRIVPKREEV